MKAIYLEKTVGEDVYSDNKVTIGSFNKGTLNKLIVRMRALCCATSTTQSDTLNKSRPASPSNFGDLLSSTHDVIMH